MWGMVLTNLHVIVAEHTDCNMPAVAAAAAVVVEEAGMVRSVHSQVGSMHHTVAAAAVAEIAACKG